MTSRLTVLPDERFVSLGDALQERLTGAARQIDSGNFASLLDLPMRTVITDGFSKTGAHEGTVWLLDSEREHLVAAFNNGPRAAEFVGVFKQPLRAGMISLVLASEQPLCENRVYASQTQDKTLDSKLHLVTCAMLAVPFYFARQARGVISCVQLKPAASDAADPPGFAPCDLQALQFAATLLSRLIDHRLLALVLGREHFL